MIGLLLFLLGFGVSMIFNSASAAPLDEQLLLKQLSDLQAKVVALERSVADHERRLSQLESVIHVSAGGLTIESSNITIKAAGSLSLKGSRIQQN